MAEALSERDRLRRILEEIKRAIIHRAIAAWDRSTETFGEEIVALNDVNQALKDLR